MTRFTFSRLAATIRASSRAQGLNHGEPLLFEIFEACPPAAGDYNKALNRKPNELFLMVRARRGSAEEREAEIFSAFAFDGSGRWFARSEVATG